MKKVKYIIYTLSLLFVLFLFGCKTKSIEITAQITSLSSTETSITFYGTILCDIDITARAVLEQDGKQLDEIEPLTIGSTKEYSFSNLTSGTEYSVLLQVKTNSNYITYAKENIKTLGSFEQDVVISCEDASFTYDGKGKFLSASTNVEGLKLEYKYTINGVIVEEPTLVGEYRCEISFVGNEAYAPCSIVRFLTIKKADLTIEAENEEFVYDGKPKALSASIKDNYPLSITYFLENKKIEEPVQVGEYKVVITFAGSDLYNSASIERTLKITPCPVEFSLTSFKVDYNEDYTIDPKLSMDYKVIYYQNEEELLEKPNMPGTYLAKVVITDPNYIGSSQVSFVIDKCEYIVNYQDMFLLEGTAPSFQVDDFVQIEYYLNKVKVDEISVVGEYEVVFSFINHEFYKDLNYKIKVIVDNKYHINITAKDILIEEQEAYDLVYTTNPKVSLKAKYYFNGVEINKPVEVGIYTVRLYYEEDETYNSAEKIINLSIYPRVQKINQIVDGLYHIQGTVIGKDDTLCYICDDTKVLFVADTSLEVGSSYDIVGVFDSTGKIEQGSVLKRTKIYPISISTKEVSLLDFPDALEECLYQLTELKGMVIYKDNTYGLALKEDYFLPLDSRVKIFYEEQMPITIRVIFYGTTFIWLDYANTELDDAEKVYAEALFYMFSDIEQMLPKETKTPFETSISYISSSNPNVISITPLLVIPSKEDVVVQVVVRFTIGTYFCDKEFSIKVLKEEIKELKIYSLEMHQQYGDSTLITYGDYDILIDAGDKNDGPYVNKFLKEHISEDNHLDMIIVTHCHSDHMGGLAYASNESLSNVKALDGISSIGTIIDYGHDRSSNALHNSWVNIRNSYINKGAEYYPVYDCAKNINGASSHHQIDHKLSFDFIDTMTYAMPSQNISTELNIYSVATLLTFENFKFFFAGDLEDKGESNLYKNIQNTVLKNITEENVVLYKAAHHGTDPGGNNGGTNGGNQLPFLKSLKPDYFFVSAAMCSGNYPNNSSGEKFIGGQPHPYIKCIANFLRFNDNIYFNGTNGTLEFVTDGLEMKNIHGYGATTKYLLEVNGAPIDYASQADLKLVQTLWYRKNRKAAVDNVLGN